MYKRKRDARKGESPRTEIAGYVMRVCECNGARRTRKIERKNQSRSKPRPRVRPSANHVGRAINVRRRLRDGGCGYDRSGGGGVVVVVGDNDAWWRGNAVTGWRRWRTISGESDRCIRFIGGKLNRYCITPVANGHCAGSAFCCERDFFNNVSNDFVYTIINYLISFIIQE